MAARGKRDQNLWRNIKQTYDIETAGSMSDRPSSPHGALRRKALSLADLKPGECGTILRLQGNFCGRLRLLEMGLTPGTHLRMIRVAAFGGPIDIEVRGYQLSLRRDEAAAVWLGDNE